VQEVTDMAGTAVSEEAVVLAEAADMEEGNL
jgi:hypothetical protein